MASVFNHSDLFIFCFEYSPKALFNDFKVLLCLFNILKILKARKFSPFFVIAIAYQQENSLAGNIVFAMSGIKSFFA